MTYWKKPDFKALQQAWYQVLESEGFQDAEELIGDDMQLKLSHRNRRRYYRNQDVSELYFCIVSTMLHTTNFRNDVDRHVIEGHCQGKKAETICQELRERGTPRFRHAIRFIVRRYELRWGLRNWTPQQLGRKVS